jgi:hypothetical protein
MVLAVSVVSCSVTRKFTLHCREKQRIATDKNAASSTETLIS